MNKSTSYLISLIASTGTTAVGFFFKIQHQDNAPFFLLLGGILSIPFVYLGIVDAVADRKNESPVKLMWSIGFIFLSCVAGFAYLGNFKRRNST